MSYGVLWAQWNDRIPKPNPHCLYFYRHTNTLPQTQLMSRYKFSIFHSTASYLMFINTQLKFHGKIIYRKAISIVVSMLFIHKLLAYCYDMMVWHNVFGT